MKLYRDFATTEEIDAEYNVLGNVADPDAIIRGWVERGAAAAARLDCRLGVPYGPTLAEHNDIFPAGKGAPLHVFIHGGYWRRFSAREHSFVAPPLTARGIAVVVVNYALCPFVTIDEIVRQVRAVPVRKQIILVDDCSKDGTTDVLKKWVDSERDLTILFHPVNRGKGAALRTGFQHATGQLVIVQDADLEYDPNEYPRLIQPILEGRADVVFGSRFIGETHRVLFYWHSMANRFLTLLSNMFTNLNLTDMEVCYKVFRREVIQGITLKSDRFGFEPEVTAKVARFMVPPLEGRPSRKCRIYEMPVSYNGRDYAEGKKIGWKDGVQALYCIVRYAWWD